MFYLLLTSSKLLMSSLKQLDYSHLKHHHLILGFELCPSPSSLPFALVFVKGFKHSREIQDMGTLDGKLQGQSNRHCFPSQCSLDKMLRKFGQLFLCITSHMEGQSFAEATFIQMESSDCNCQKLSIWKGLNPVSGFLHWILSCFWDKLNIDNFVTLHAISQMIQISWVSSRHT